MTGPGKAIPADYTHVRIEDRDSEYHAVGLPLPWRAKLRNLPPIHELLYLSRFVDMRNRLRCPDCEAVGTFKMHGGYIDAACDWIEERIKGEKPEFPRRPVRRWLCKYCGYYEGPEGLLRAFPDKVWKLPHPDHPRTPTPADVVAEHGGKAWPWRG